MTDMAKSKKIPKSVQNMNILDIDPSKLKASADKIKQSVESPKPKPKAAEPTPTERSVQVRIGESYKKRVKAEASKEGITMQDYLETLIDKALDEE